MLTENNQTLSQEYKQLEIRRLSYKNYIFFYNPQSIQVTEDSRLAEYRYLFSDGAEFSKVRGVTKVTLQGVFIAGPLKTIDATIGSTTSFEIVRKMKELANNEPGVLVLPGLGRYDVAFITDTTFEENGEYAKNVNFTIEFVIGRWVTPIAQVQTSSVKGQGDIPDSQKTNVSYTIVKGDNLTRIANRFGVTLGTLKALNPNLFDAKHRNGNLIHPGEVVIIQKGSAKTEIPLPPTGTMAVGNWGSQNGSKLTTIESTSDIGRDARLETFIDNKDNKVRQVPKLVDVLSLNVAGYPTQLLNIVSKFPEYYRNFLNGDMVNISSGTNQRTLGYYKRSTSTTLDMWIDEKNKKITDEERKIPKDEKNTIFPIFQGLIEYAKDRKGYVDSLNKYVINDNLNAV